MKELIFVANDVGIGAKRTTKDNWLLLMLGHTYHNYLAYTRTQNLELSQVNICASEITKTASFIFMLRRNGDDLNEGLCSMCSFILFLD